MPRLVESTRLLTAETDFPKSTRRYAHQVWRLGEAEHHASFRFERYDSSLRQSIQQLKASGEENGCGTRKR
jgi:hypothetical protein